MTTRLLFWLVLLATLAMPAANAANVADKDAACIGCHEKLVQGKTAHKGPKAGCSSCHNVIDGSKTPHRTATDAPKAVTVKGDALCLNCHDAGKFKGKKPHRAMKSGCTYCHDPHASKHEGLLTMAKTDLCLDCHADREDIQPDVKVRHRAGKQGCTYCHEPHVGERANLLTMDVPDLCRDCHDDDAVGAKARHAPVKEGKCLGCHSPHGGAHAALLLKPGPALCRECHKDIEKTPHAVTGFKTGGHPLGGENSGLRDPLRPGKPFDCFSCHEPHDSKLVGLLRVDPEKPKVFCQACHKL